MRLLKQRGSLEQVALGYRFVAAFDQGARLLASLLLTDSIDRRRRGDLPPIRCPSSGSCRPSFWRSRAMTGALTSCPCRSPSTSIVPGRCIFLRDSLFLRLLVVGTAAHLRRVHGLETRPCSSCEHLGRRRRQDERALNMAQGRVFAQSLLEFRLPWPAP